MSMLKEKILDLPKSPGVYQFIGAGGDILYVGKAKNLHNRLKSYFAKEIGRGPGIDLMVAQACDIKVIETESEIEAVILEADLIGKLKPKYNIRLRDDKSFLMIKITKPNYSSSESRLIETSREASDSSRLSESQRSNNSAKWDKLSRVELVRYKNADLHDKSAWYFGPYPAGDLLKKSLRYLRRIFPYMDCASTKYNRYSKLGRSCLYGDLGICPAPCVFGLSSRAIEAGESRDLLKDPSTSVGMTGRESVGMTGRESVGMTGREISIRGRRTSVSPPFEGGVRGGYLSVAEYQKNITYLKNFLRGKKKEVRSKLEKEMRHLSKTNHFEQAAIIRDRIYALDHISDVAVGLKDDFTSPGKLAFPRIECYDISNISGRFAVGSMVVFSNGEADKDEYRKFRIRNNALGARGKSQENISSNIPNTNYEIRNTIDGAGDLQMMQQVLERRFTHTPPETSRGTSRNSWPLPNLLIVDGGATHVTLVSRVLKARKLDVPVIGIAKGPRRDKDEFHFSNHAIAAYIKKNPEIQVICIKARNEAHRFAGNYYRKLHSKNMLQ